MIESAVADSWLHERLDADPALAALAPLQRIVVTGATGGTFTLSFGGPPSVPIAWNAPPIGPGSVQATLEALAGIGSKATLVRQEAAGGWSVVFLGTLTNTLTPITGSGAGLTGPAPALTITQLARIYVDTAPQGTPFPYVLASATSPGQDVSVIGAIRVMVESVYVVRGVVSGGEYSAALTQIAGRIDSLLHRQQGPVVGGGSIIASYRESIFRLPETTNGVQYRHLGGQYRLLVQS